MCLMQYLTCVLLALAIVASQEVEAADDLSAICQRLDDTRYKGEVRINADGEKLYNFANNQLAQLASFGNLGEVGQLRAAWDRALHRKGCYPDVLRDVATIAKCDPERFEAMSSLTQATRSLANECFSPSYISSKIEEASGGGASCFMPNCLKGISANVLIDHFFIEKYQQLHYEDLWMNLSAIETGKAIYPLYKSILRELESRKKSAERMNFRIDLDGMGKYLNKYLHKPCNSFVHATNGVMDKIFAASRFFDDGLRGLLLSLDELAQEDVFRYTLCKKFLDERRPEKLANEVSDEFLLWGYSQ